VHFSIPTIADYAMWILILQSNRL